METTIAPLDTVTAPALTTADRCDRCGSQAYVRATMTTGADLLFCSHHAHEHRPALLGAGATFQDETDKLTSTRASGYAA